MNDTSGKPGPFWRRMDPRLLAAVAGIIVLALVAGGVALARRGGGPEGENGDDARKGEATSTAASTSTPSPSSPTRPGGTAGKPSSGTSAGSPRPGAPTSGKPGAPLERPKAPATEGSKLATITAPPDKTLALLDPKKVSADIEWDIEFSPYGFAPSAPGSPKRIVIAITTATKTAGKDTELSLNDRNMLVLLDAKETVTLGGKYTGHLNLREQGGVLVPILSGIREK